jgi:hypothetical protein
MNAQWNILPAPPGITVLIVLIVTVTLSVAREKQSVSERENVSSLDLQDENRARVVIEAVKTGIEARGSIGSIEVRGREGRGGEGRNIRESRGEKRPGGRIRDGGEGMEDGVDNSCLKVY